jgi:hypothetical protein
MIAVSQQIENQLVFRKQSFRFVVKSKKPIGLSVPRVKGYPVAADRHARGRTVMLDST